MRVVEEIVRNESVEDVLTVFALNMGIPRLDMMYGHYRKEVVLSGELFSVFQRLVNERVLASSGSWHSAKGPSWKAPAFVTEGKYDNFIEE
ncbi:immunity protein [Pseudomonas syringae]|nr:immunity protein [Pseudomonas syringae]